MDLAMIHVDLSRSWTRLHRGWSDRPASWPRSVSRVSLASHGTPRPRSQWVLCRWVLCLVVASGACRSEEPAAVARAAEFDPCGGSDHPCTLADVTPEARARTDELAEGAHQRIGPAGDLEVVTEWLEQQEDVVSLATGDEAVRFRVRGGRGHWILVNTLNSVATLAAPTIRKPPRMPAASAASAASVTSVASAASAAPAVQGTTKGREKKALLLSPFRWQWEIQGDDDGLDAVAQALQARDYTQVDLFTERLDPQNPACGPPARARSGYVTRPRRWDDCKTIGDIGLLAFTNWGEYDYVHLLTHGGAVREGDRSLTAVMTSWTLEELATAQEVWSDAPDSERRDDLVGLMDRMGLETASVHGIALNVTLDEVPWVGAGQRRWPYVSIQNIRAAEDLAFQQSTSVPLNPDLDAREAAYCRRILAENPDSRRVAADLDRAQVPAGRPCAVYPESTGTGNFVMLSSRFFRQTYPDGIDDAVIVLSACSSGFSSGSATDPDLLDAFNGDNTAVVGWTKAVSIGAAAAAGKMLAEVLVQVDETVEDDSGLTVGQAIQKVKELIDEGRASAPSDAECRSSDDPSCAFQHGQVLSVINDLPADRITGATLTVVGDSALRAREIVYLVDEAGEELKTGGLIPVTGAAGDGRADSVELKIRVDGLEREENPEDVDLHIVFEDREIDVEEDLEREVAKGVWEVGTLLPLGRDHRDGELVDLELVGILPDEGESRWLYEDIRLGGCYWTATLSGTAEGAGGIDRRLSGGYVGFGPMPGVEWSSVTLGQAPGSEQTESLSFWVLGDLAETDYALGPRRPDGTVMWSTPEVPWGQANRSALRIAMLQPDTMLVGGFVSTYDGLTLPEFGAGDLSIRGEFVWTPSCPTGWDLMMDLGERTKALLDERGIGNEGGQ